MLGVLAARGLDLDPAQRLQIEHEQDMLRLERWITHVAVCASVEDLLAS